MGQRDNQIIEMGDHIPLLAYVLSVLMVTLICTIYGANLRAALFLLYIVTMDDIE